MKKLILFLFLSLVISHLSFAEVRYVSHSGNNTPPYLTWETAADSIMSAINISSSGDTIYVANGVYEEQVVMIPGLSLIGSGADSCIIDTHNLVTTQNSVSVRVGDSCHLEGFHIAVYNNWDKGVGVSVNGSSVNSLITLNKITDGYEGIYLGNNPIIYKNTFDRVSIGIDLFNSDAVVRKNIISTDPNSQLAIIAGIHIEAFDFSYHPVIDSNYIETERRGINKSYGARPVISNNEILLKGVGGEGILLGGPSDTAKVFNNKIYALSGMEGIYPSGVQYLYLYNNYLSGNYDDQQNLLYVITLGPDQTAKNNVVTNAERGVKAVGTQNLTFQYNNVWNNDINYTGFTPDSTNISVNPMVVNEDTTNGGPDFHLQAFSPLIDAGDPSILDRDGSRSDIGLYGGPYGEVYTYNDLAPRPPHNVTAVIEQGLVKLTWNRNTEADFSHYRIYRDTVSNFIYDTTKIIGETTDTVYYDNLPPVNGEKNYYYLITAFDNQGNQSYPGEEVTVQVTGLAEHPPIGSDGYRLLPNYPNPFNPSTVIPYRLKEAGYVKLYIYDVKGELVRVLVNQWQEKGYYEAVFKPTTAERSRTSDWNVPIGPTLSDMASGVYLYMIMVSNNRNVPVFTDMGKMILLK